MRIIGLELFICISLCTILPVEVSAQGLRPYEANPLYWEYKGKPVMLLGGSKDDNLFQIPDLEEHLDLLVKVGGNYIRNTMSSRDSGNFHPFKQLENGKYDLDQWDIRYWQRFEQLIRLTAGREIIVQIELWDQWDFNEGRWDNVPWNPVQNINYSISTTHLKGDGHYADVNHLLGRGRSLSREDSIKHGAPLDFFMTVPSLNNDKEVLAYQQRFIDKLLSYTLRYDHILYTISNELFIQHSPKWSLYWTNYLKKKAHEEGKDIYITEMFHHHDIKHQQHRFTFDQPGIFGFVDISQNSVQGIEPHWNNLQWLRSYISEPPRPINHTKTYGTAERSVPKFWNNIIGGAASCRFHRPDHGIGLNEVAQTHLRSMRMWLEEYDIFTSQPDSEHHLLTNRESGEAFCTFRDEQQYTVYFPNGGDVELKVPQGRYRLNWLNIEKNRWQGKRSMNINSGLKLHTPGKGHWLVLITRIK